MVLILAFADKQFFKNLEEVKKVILADAGVREHLCGSGKTKWVFDCIKSVHASRMNWTQMRNTYGALVARPRA
jgi:hypothetical protein